MKVSSSKSIQNASQEALRAIAEATSIATKTVAAAAAEAVKVKENQNSTDHDALIELKTLMIGLKEDIRELTDGTSRRIAFLESNKLDTKDSYSIIYKGEVDKRITDHEVRINAMETNHTRTTVLVSIGIGILTLLVGILVQHIVYGK